MILHITEQDLARALNEETLERGTEVWENGQVRRCESAKDGTAISGSVQGSRRQPYSQTIMLTMNGLHVRIHGYCTCPMRINCKHVAALLLEHVMMAPAGSSVTAPPEKTPLEMVRIPLSNQVTGWLDRIAGQVNPAAAEPTAFRANQRALHYVLNHELSFSVAGTAPARVRAIKVRLRKDGGLSDPKPFDPNSLSHPGDHNSNLLAEADVDILRDLAWLRRLNHTPGNADIALGPDATSLRTLNALIGTGRLHLGTLDGSVLRRGPDARAEPRWIKSGLGAQRLTLVPLDVPVQSADVEAKFDVLLPLAPPHYVDVIAGQVGVVESGLAPRLAAEVACAPAIIASQAAQVKELMRQRIAAPRPPLDLPAGATTEPPATSSLLLLPLPDAPDKVETRTIKPVPRLDLLLTQAKLRTSHYWYSYEPRLRGPFTLPIAVLSFDYGDTNVAINAPGQMLEHMEGERLILTPRDAKAEAKAADRLAGLGCKRISGLPIEVQPAHAHGLFVAPPGSPSAAEIIDKLDVPSRFIAFSAEALPELVREGWHVAFSDDYPYRIAEGETQWWADVGEGSGIDWMSFELGITFDGHRINLVPHLAEVLSRLSPEFAALAFQPGSEDRFIEQCSHLRTYHTLPDGRLLPLPGKRIAPILKSLLELIGPRASGLVDGKVKLHRAEAGALARFANATELSGLAWAASAERLIELGRSLSKGRGLAKIDPPKSFKAKLRPYQAEGLAWLDFLRESGFGGVLADDMGLGKTVQALAFLAREKAEGRLDKPALIIAPTSVLPNWQAETERFAPKLSVLALRGLERRHLFAGIPKHDLVLTTYPLLMRDHEVLLAQEFHIAILDEAQAIKNPKASVSSFAHRINARHRLALTGTPLENNLGEVWSLFEFLAPGLLGDEGTFRRTFRTPIEKHGCQTSQAFLSRRLKPFMLRRTKEAVATELPPKTEIIERVRLEGGQRDLYETVRSLMHAKVRDEISKKGLAKSHIIFLDALLKLRQICCDPRLLKMTQARKVKSSAKLERLMEMIPELVGEGRRILLFSQFTSMLELIEDELGKLKIPFVKLTGDTTDRAAPVREFQTGKVPLFLLSLKAGGTGLNLTAADTVIHYDPWWNPAVENQATDRAHRIGQDKPVFVYKLIVEEGIEEAIELLKARKAALAAALFDGNGKAGFNLTETDISALFAPLDKVPQRRAA